MKLVDNGLGGDTDSGNEETGTALDDDIDELVELSLCVIIANRGVPLATALSTRRSRWGHMGLTLSCARFHRLEEGEGRHRRGRSCPSGSS